MTEPTPATPAPFTIKATPLLAIAVCAASERMRYALDSVLLRPAKDGPRTVIEATDGRILGRIHIDAVAPGTYAFSRDLLKRLKPDDDIEIEDGVMTIRALMLRVDLLPPEGKFPDSDAVIPALTREGSPVLGAGEGPFGKAFTVLKKLKADGCRFGIGKSHEPVLITTNTVYGRVEIAVMPLAQDESEKPTNKERVIS